MPLNKKSPSQLHSETVFVNHANQKWLDCVSDIDSLKSSNNLLPTPQELQGYNGYIWKKAAI
jgi:hypothetical protein